MTPAETPPRAGSREWLGLAVLALPTLMVSLDDLSSRGARRQPIQPWRCLRRNGLVILTCHVRWGRVG